MSVAENLRAPGAPTATVLIDGVRYDLPVFKGTLGPDGFGRVAFHGRYWRPFMKAVIQSIGTGKRMVEFFSAAMSVSVCR